MADPFTTYSNGPAFPEVTMEALLRTAREIGALGPPPPREFTVSPIVADALRDHAPPSGVREVSSVPPVLQRFVGGPTIHVDETLPPGTWHPGPPRFEVRHWPDLALSFRRPGF